MNIQINILEVASELAHKEVEKVFNFKAELIYIEVSDDMSIYTENAQDIFNQFYDEFYDFLWNLKEE
jgi:hypothetical protein